MMVNMKLGRNEENKTFLVALSNQDVILCQGKIVLHKMQATDFLVSMWYFELKSFGKYGRESGCLIMVFKERGLEVRILDRKFSIQKCQSYSKLVDEKDTPLPLPQKTNLFLKDMQRESDQAESMHLNFQYDLQKCRFTTAQNYMKLISDGGGSETVKDIKIFAQIDGIGP